MSGYQYQALNVQGRTCKGVIEADSERHARQLLREQGFIPTQISPFKKTTQRWFARSLSSQDLCLLTRQLATLLSAGIPIEEALQGVTEQSSKASVRQILLAVRARVLEGYGLAQAMNEAPQAFPELYRATIAAGEQTGRLDVVLEKLADYTEYQQQTQQKIQQALIYPSLMVIVSTTIIAFLLRFVVPKIIEVFKHNEQTLPLATRILLLLSDGLRDYGLYLLILILLAAALFMRALTYPDVKQRWHGLLLKIPGIRYLIVSINVARYTHTFAILFSAGVSVLETMRVAASLITNHVMREAFNLAALHVKEGKSIHHALQETTFISPMAMHLIASGEKSGQLAPMMERAALHLDQTVRSLIDTAMTLLEPLVIIFMGGVILFIVLATLLPIFSMEQLVT
jgi:general secretion pathway protein F